MYAGLRVSEILYLFWPKVISLTPVLNTLRMGYSDRVDLIKAPAMIDIETRQCKSDQSTALQATGLIATGSLQARTLLTLLCCPRLQLLGFCNVAISQYTGIPP
jgi:hypothetical protein